MATVVLTNLTYQALQVDYFRNGVHSEEILPGRMTREYEVDTLGHSTVSLIEDKQLKIGGSLPTVTPAQPTSSVPVHLQFEVWDANQDIKVGTIVERNGTIYLSKAGSKGFAPESNPDKWYAFASATSGGSAPVSVDSTAWGSATAYSTGALVKNGDNWYLAIEDSTNQEPGEAGSETYWLMWGTGADGASANLTPPFVTLADGATITCVCDMSKATQNAKFTLGGDRTLAFTSLTDGMTGVIIVRQDATGGRTLTLPAGSRVQNSGNGAVTLTALANAHDVLSWTYDGEFLYWTVGNHFN